MITNVKVDYLAGCNPKKIIPSYASLDESVYYVLEASERDFNDMMMNIGISELHHLETTGSEVVYEADEAKKESIKEKTIKWVKNFWQGIQALINKAVDFVAKKLDEVKANHYDKLKLAQRITYVDDKVTFGTTYLYTGFNSNYIKTVTDAGKVAESTIFNKVKEYESKIKAGNTDAINDVETTVNTYVDSFIKGITSSAADKDTAASELTSIIKNKIRDKEITADKAWVNKHISEIEKELGSASGTKRILKKNYNDFKSICNGTIKEIESYGKGNKGDSFDGASFMKAIAGVKKIKSVSACANQASISCVTERFKFYNHVASVIVAKGKFPKEANKKVPGAPVGEATTFDMVDSLFNW